MTGPAPDLAALRREIRRRRLRDRLFDGAGVCDPAWDILLDLELAALEDKPVSVSSACIAAAVAPKTGLRHVHHLIDTGWCARSPDPADRRRAWLTLGPRAIAAFAEYRAAPIVACGEPDPTPQDGLLRVQALVAQLLAGA